MGYLGEVSYAYRKGVDVFLAHLPLRLLVEEKKSGENPSPSSMSTFPTPSPRCRSGCCGEG